MISQTFQDLSPNGEKVSGMTMICPHGSWKRNWKIPLHVIKGVMRQMKQTIQLEVGYKERVNTVERLRDCCQWEPLTV